MLGEKQLNWSFYPPGDEFMIRSELFALFPNTRTSSLFVKLSVFIFENKYDRHWIIYSTVFCSYTRKSINQSIKIGTFFMSTVRLNCQCWSSWRVLTSRRRKPRLLARGTQLWLAVRTLVPQTTEPHAVSCCTKWIVFLVYEANLKTMRGWGKDISITTVIIILHEEKKRKPAGCQSSKTSSHLWKICGCARCN